jgi:hypothetical protein
MQINLWSLLTMLAESLTMPSETLALLILLALKAEAYDNIQMRQ